MTRKSLEHLSTGFHSLIVLSELLLASVCPSGLKAIDQTLHDQKRFGVALHTQVPQLDCLIRTAAASKGLPIGANRNGINPT